MKRMRRWIILLLLLMPALALAQPAHAPYELSLSIRYSEASPVQQALFDLLYDAAWRGAEQVTLPEGTAYSDVTAVHDLLAQEAPELCALDPTWSIWYYGNEPDKASAVTLRYCLPVRAQEMLMRAAWSAAQAADNADGAYVRALTLHDMLCARVTYDAGSANAHNAYGALVEGAAVCDGYAGAYALLLRLSGIPSSVITGEALEEHRQTWEAHSWTMAELCGEPLLFDTTWDDQPNAVSHWYFALPEQWMARDHRRQTPIRASASIAWNWHLMNGSYVPAGQGTQAVYEALRRLAQTGACADLRFEDETDYLAAATDFSAVWDAYNRQAPQAEQLYGRLSWRVSGPQQCLLIEPAP